MKFRGSIAKVGQSCLESFLLVLCLWKFLFLAVLSNWSKIYCLWWQNSVFGSLLPLSTDLLTCNSHDLGIAFAHACVRACACLAEISKSVHRNFYFWQNLGVPNALEVMFFLFYPKNLVWPFLTHFGKKLAIFAKNQLFGQCLKV